MLTNYILRQSLILKQIIKKNILLSSNCNYSTISKSSQYLSDFLNNKKHVNKMTYKFHVSNAFSTTKISKQQIQSSTYEQLINKITKLYNYQQYKIPSSLALLEIHHQYKIFKAGDWVLDIGAGPNWGWTDLALKLTHTKNNINKVISNDLTQCQFSKQNHTHITGNFLQQQIQTKIAMNLIDKQLNTILIDATPKYSGNQQFDAQYTMQIFINTLKFAQRYLKKGGNIIFKTIQSSSSLQNQQQSKFFFNQVYRYKSSCFRIDSPTFFYVLKGFMMTDNLQGVSSLLKQYANAKNSYSKTKIIQKYRQKYSWNPASIIINQAKQNIVKLKQQGKKNKQISKLYQKDPYVKANQILQLLDKLEDKQANPVEKLKAEKKLVSAESQIDMQLPQNQQQFAQTLFKNVQKIARQQRQENQKKSRKKRGKKNNQQTSQKVQQKAPLAQNQVYMKSNAITQKDQKHKNTKINRYTQQDLYGYNVDDPYKSINRKLVKSIKQHNTENQIQLQKLIKSFPQVKKAFKQNNINSKQDIEKTQQKFMKQFFSLQQQQQPNKQGEQKILNKKRYEDFKQFKQMQNQQQIQSIFESKDSARNKNKYRNLAKTAQKQSLFDFDSQKQSQLKQKQQILQNQELAQEQAIAQSRVQYLKSKPRKSAKSVYQKRSQQSSSQTKARYFKAKKRDY